MRRDASFFQNERPSLLGLCEVEFVGESGELQKPVVAPVLRFEDVMKLAAPGRFSMRHDSPAPAVISIHFLGFSKSDAF